MHFRRFAFLTLLLAASSLRGDEASDNSDFGSFVGFEDRVGFFYDLKAGFNLASIAAKAGFSNNRVTGLLGGGTSYFFGPSLGAYLETHFTSRGLTSGGVAAANFVDLMGGVVWNRGSGWFNNVVRETYRLGILFARPLGSFRGGLTLPFSGESQGALGVHLETVVVFPMADHIGVGYTAWIKALLSSPIKATHVTFIDAGFGLVATFF